MLKNANEVIKKTAEKLTDIQGGHNVNLNMLVEKSEVVSIIDDLMYLSFAGYFDKNAYGQDFAKTLMFDIFEKLSAQIQKAMTFSKLTQEDIEEKASSASLDFVAAIPGQVELLKTDVKAHFEGDPAAADYEEIILSYPGLYAISVHRFAHILYELNVPYIPRIMSEYAHAKTGIDINPGARIGKGLFIDHGTGVVIGETAEIGDNVQIYQGVTLGALSPRHGQSLSGSKRHPTVEDDVTIYANATVLGGETVIGKGTVISGNTTIVKSVRQGVRVSAKIDEPHVCDICKNMECENKI